MNPSNLNRPQRIEDRTVSRRSEPSSRTLLTGEQPDPWDLLQPQDRMSRHRNTHLLPNVFTIPSSSQRGASVIIKVIKLSCDRNFYLVVYILTTKSIQAA